MPEYKFMNEEKIDIKSRHCSPYCPIFDWYMDEDIMYCRLNRISWNYDSARPFPCPLQEVE